MYISASLWLLEPIKPAALWASNSLTDKSVSIPSAIAPLIFTDCSLPLYTKSGFLLGSYFTLVKNTFNTLYLLPSFVYVFQIEVLL